MIARFDPDRSLLAAARNGDVAATDGVIRAAADLVWTACVRVTRARAESEAAFRDVMAALRADNFARLRGYDGRSRLRSYLALVVRDLLCERVFKVLALDIECGWRAFEAFFAADIRRIILRLLPGADHRHNREDAYQSVCEALLKNDLQRLRAYSGRGSPSGFVLHVIENLAIDHARTIVPRRRLPAPIQRLTEFDQAVFRLLYWQQIAAEPSILVVHLAQATASPTADAVADAIARVRAAVPPGYRVEAHRHGQTIDISAADGAVLAGGAEDFGVPTPEETLADSETAGLLDRALDALQHAVPKLDASERLYLQLALAGEPAREIARLLGVPPPAIHKLAQKVKKRLRDEIGTTEAVKNWRLSV